MLTQTELDDVFCIRFVVGAQRTTDAHVRRAFDVISAEADRTTEAWGKSFRKEVAEGLMK